MKNIIFIKKYVETNRDTLLFGVCIVIFYAILQLMGVTCPIKFLTGISCPGCGMSRAWLSLLKFNIRRAYFYHPLFLFPILAGVLFFSKKKLPKRVYNICLYLMLLIFFVVYIKRMILNEGTIVVCHMQEGFIYRIVRRIILIGGSLRR